MSSKALRRIKIENLVIKLISTYKRPIACYRICGDAVEVENDKVVIHSLPLIDILSKIEDNWEIEDFPRLEQEVNSIFSNNAEVLTISKEEEAIDFRKQCLDCKKCKPDVDVYSVPSYQKYTGNSWQAIKQLCEECRTKYSYAYKKSNFRSIWS